MSEQKQLSVHFYTESGKEFSVVTDNSFRKFFSYLPGLIGQSEPWTEVDFDRALRGFCAQSYPKENLWELMVHKSEMVQVEEQPAEGVDSYPGVIPEELKPFYDYRPRLKKKPWTEIQKNSFFPPLSKQCCDAA
jgi:hypothetical protein